MSSFRIGEVGNLQFEALILDMDGLLVDSERLSFEAWQKAGAQSGYEITKEIFSATVGKSLTDTYAVYKQAFGDGFPGEQMRAMKNKIFADNIRKNGLPAKNGSRELLEYLDVLNIPWAVATTTKREATLLRLRHAELDSLVRVLVCGDEVAHTKPRPDLYLEAASFLGISPSLCLVTEDSDTGAQAGWNAGMQVVLVPDMKEPSAESVAKALCVLPDLCVLKGLISCTASKV